MVVVDAIASMLNDVTGIVQRSPSEYVCWCLNEAERKCCCQRRQFLLVFTVYLPTFYLRQTAFFSNCFQTSVRHALLSFCETDEKFEAPHMERCAAELNIFQRFRFVSFWQ